MVHTVFHAAQLVERRHGDGPARLQHLVAQRAQDVRVECEEVRNVRERTCGLGKTMSAYRRSADAGKNRHGVARGEQHAQQLVAD